MTLRHAAPFVCAASILAGVLSLPGRALAADDATVEMARARFREGVQFFDQKQYEKARLAFLQAYALKPHPAVLLNLAQSELRSGHPADAATHFSEYLRKGTDVAAAQKQEATTGLAAAKAKVGEVTITADTTGAQITVDGEARGAAPLSGPVYLQPGSHAIEARAGDHRTSRSVSVSAGQTTSVELSLSGAPAAVAAAEPPGPAPAPKKEEHREAPAAEPAESAPVEAAAAGAPEQPVEETPTGPDNSFPGWFARTPLAWVGAGVGVAGVGGGVTMAVLSSRDYSNANSIAHDIDQGWKVNDLPYLTAYPLSAGSAPCKLNGEARYQLTLKSQGGNLDPSKTTGSQPVLTAQQFDVACSRYKNNADAADTKKILAIAFTSVGAAAIVGTVIYYFLDTSRASSSTASRPKVEARVIPILSPELNGLVVTGRF